MSKVILRYLLFQIPSLFLIVLILTLIEHWLDIPKWIFWGSITLWVIKDIILYPFVWKAYDRNRLRELYTLIGIEGVTETPLAPSGYISVHGELWQAVLKGERPIIGKGKSVKILDIQGLRLIVEPKTVEEESDK